MSFNCHQAVTPILSMKHSHMHFDAIRNVKYQGSDALKNYNHKMRRQSCKTLRVNEINILFCLMRI